MQKYKMSKTGAHQTLLNTDADEQKKLEELVKSHASFNKFVCQVEFDEYLKQYTYKPVTKANGASSHEPSNDDLILELTKVVSNPAIMDKVLEMFLANQKL